MDVQPVAAPEARIIGRQTELDRVAAFVAAREPARALVLFGAAGVGKTTIWEAGSDLARDAGLLVLAARPTDAETAPAYATLTDLLDPVDIEVEEVPAPQRRALAIAVRRLPPDASPPDAFTISAGFFSLLRALARERSILVAIDDIQWLDAASAEALVFGARRLRHHHVRFLVARRPGPASSLERALDVDGVARVELGPISLGAARALLLQRLGLAPSRRVLRRIVESAQGNPAFVLELARALAERGPDAVADDLPMPELGDNPFAARVRRASGPVHDLLLAVALAGDLTRRELTAIGSAAAVDEAIDGGLLVVDGERIRVAHPLVAAAAREDVSVHGRRAMHRVLAGAVMDGARRSRHLALAADAPNRELAADLDASVNAAIGRGASSDAAELAEHALRLTAPGSPEHDERLLKLGECLERVGDQARLVALLAPAIDGMAPGPTRARAHLLLVGSSSPDEHEAHLQEALRESTNDPALRARLIESRAILAAGIRGVRIREAEGWLEEALPLAHQGGQAVEALVVHSLAWVRMLRAVPIDDLLAQLESLVQNPLDQAAIGHLVAQRHLFRGEIVLARRMFRQLLAEADERGDARYLRLHFQLCGLELRAGAVDDAAGLLREEADWSGTAAGGSRTSALMAAIKGNATEAEERAAAAIDESVATGYGWSRLEGLRARGVAALVRGDAAGAAESLGTVWEHAAREGFDNPGIFPVAADLVEALAELGRVDDARGVTARLEELATAQDHPWAAASVPRCSAAIRAPTGGELDLAEAELVSAADAFERLGLQFDEARSRLLLGRLQRRARRWAASRESLEVAAGLFQRTGCTGWAHVARLELERVGARRPSPTGVLSPAERRVAELAAQGMSNKEIAGALFVSVYTVEAHLTRAYAKLGVRSRAQLARRLDPAP